MSKSTKDTYPKEGDRVSFVKAAHLESINLMSCKYDANFVPNAGAGTLNLEAKFNSTFDPGEENRPALFKGVCDVSISGAAKDGSRLFSLELVFEAHYTLTHKGTWPEEEINHFCDRNVVLHVWPYIREFINNLTNRSPVPPVVLPLVPFAIPKKREDAEKLTTPEHNSVQASDADSK